jgi:chemotaxis protein CheX
MQMKVEHINPFIQSVDELFSTMLQAKVQRGKVGLSDGGANPRDIMAIIGLSGPTRGTVALSFPANTALQMVSKLLDSEVHIIDENVSDGVAEIVNMVAGNAKAKMAQEDSKPIDLSLPTVLRGNNFKVDYPSQAVWLSVPFESDLGPFTLRVTFEKSG